jgi:hypothetical protein
MGDFKSRERLWKFTIGFLFAVILYLGDGAAIAQDKARKGSYLFFERPAIEDNSFLIEEAFNQSAGVLQHIFAVSVNDFHSRSLTCSFTQEIPLTDGGHQLSYSLNYLFWPSSDNPSASVSGLSDLYVSYRPLICGPGRWAMVIPRFTVVLPTGKSSDGLGGGAFGFQFNLAVTKRFSRKIITHGNVGSTVFFKYDRYDQVGGEQVLMHERNLINQNLGASIVWCVLPGLNVLLEGVANRNSSIGTDGKIEKAWENILNPGLRFSLHAKKIQIVPGVSCLLDPASLANPKGLFFYLSLEPGS